MSDCPRWKVTEKSDVHFCAEDPNGYWTVYQKWDGCLDLTRSYNRPIDEAEVDEIATIHICDVDEFIDRLRDLCVLTQKHLPNTDAAETACNVLKEKAQP